MGLSPMAVSQWKKRGVPAERVPACRSASMQRCCCCT
ncbi:hypothetical protein [Pseudomonas aeruginosa]